MSCAQNAMSSQSDPFRHTKPRTCWRWLAQMSCQPVPSRPHNLSQYWSRAWACHQLCRSSHQHIKFVFILIRSSSFKIPLELTSILWEIRLGMVVTGGFEPPACSLGNCHSIRLSYATNIDEFITDTFLGVQSNKNFFTKLHILFTWLFKHFFCVLLYCF